MTEPESGDSPSRKRRKIEVVKGYQDEGSNGSLHHKEKEDDIDEDFYSRQLYVLGHQAMKKMATSRILISGMSGLGAEIAKNVILSGVQKVCLHDTQNTEWSDLSSQCFLTKEDIGNNRATACLEKMRQLNSYVDVTSDTSADVSQILGNFDVVVLADYLYDEMVKINNLTRSKGIKLHCGNTFGLFSVLFNDFGEDFVVQDVNGEEPFSATVSCILKDGVVTCHDEIRHTLEDGDFVTFTDVEGLENLNNSGPIKIGVYGPFSFKILDLSKLQGKGGRGGFVKQVKKPQQVTFKKLDESYAIEDIHPSPLTDFGKVGRPTQIKIAMRALNNFIIAEKRHPRPWSEEDSQKFVNIAKEVGLQIFPELQLDEALMRTFARVSSGKLSPIAAAMGGISGQEVLKACTGKFMPIKWLFFDAVECLPDNDLTEEECKPLNCRYDGQIAVFGKQFQERMAKQRHFVVGAGAIGCELLKNYAMAGVGTGKDGMIYVTDMDTIEKSNLNRQFLFRSWDVGQKKSLMAAKAIRKMNPEVCITPHENCVGVETENVYNDHFFDNIDSVVNALDNVKTRTYMDRHCIYYGLPLLESGTFGTKGNTQVVIPHLTESYSSSQVPEERLPPPLCTLKNFPTRIEHTLHWAQEIFESIFTQGPLIARQYLDDPEFVKRTLAFPGSEPMDTLKQVKKVLIKDKPKSFEDCVIWARGLFEFFFNHKIKQLVHSFLTDLNNSGDQLFLTDPKRCPHPIEFDAENHHNLDFVKSGARLLAAVYQIPVSDDETKLKEALSSFKPVEFVPRIGVEPPSTKVETETIRMTARSDKRVLKLLLDELAAVSSVPSSSIIPLYFGKDKDTSDYVNFIIAASNLRARNYDIDYADKHKSMLIAGRIIPAIATTSSLVAGLVTLEMMKFVQGHKNIDKFKNSFVNLALPLITMSEPIRAPKQTHEDTEWTLWDSFDIDNEMTLKEFLDYFKKQHKLEISLISKGAYTVYGIFQPTDVINSRLNLKMSKLVEEVLKKPIGPHVRSLIFELCVNDEDGEDVKVVPFVKYKLPK